MGHQRNRGFTIIELLIVIIVIGILATLILLGYNNLSRQAAVTRIKHDVEQAYKQLDLYNVQTNGLPADQTAARSVVALSDGTTLEYTRTSTTSYCITTSSTSAQTSYYFDSATRSVLQGVCSGQVGYVSGAPVSPTVTTFVGTPGTAGYFDGTGTAARINAPGSTALDSSGNIFFSDTNNYRVRKITPAGVVSTFIGTGGAASTDGTGTAAAISLPQGLAFDSSGNLYVTEQGGHRLRKITPSGVTTTVAGNGTNTSVDGTGTAATFNNPMGVAIDASGNIFVSEYAGNKIRKVTPAGVVTTFAGSGTASSVDGTGTSASFNAPWGLAFDSSGNLFVADRNGNKIRKITPAGVVTTVAGSGTAGSTDGASTSATFRGPSGISFDTSGNLYVADVSNYLIRKLSTSGTVSTVAGISGTRGNSDGDATSAATFFNPQGVTAVGTSTLYISDTSNSLIRKLNQ